MKNRNIILIFVPIITILLVLIGIVNISKNNKSEISVQKQNQIQKKQFDVKTSEGLVTVEVTPLNIFSDSNSKFEIRFTTHSGDVNYDLVKIATLKDSNGKEYRPLSWEGKMGGHHVEGVLSFPKINTKTNSITLIIPNIDKKDRIFTWSVDSPQIVDKNQ
jgi:hypothetical protein